MKAKPPENTDRTKAAACSIYGRYILDNLLLIRPKYPNIFPDSKTRI